MSSLIRQRRAHDLWISRSHVFAFVFSSFFAAATAFFAGWVVAQSQPEDVQTTREVFASEAGDGSLLELLARVETASTPDGGVRELTFPDQLVGREAPVVEAVTPESDSVVALEAEVAELAPAGDLPPQGRWTLVVAVLEDEEAARIQVDALIERGLVAWMAPEQVDGRLMHRVGVGGWGSKSEAEEALPSYRVHQLEEPLRVQRF